MMLTETQTKRANVMREIDLFEGLVKYLEAKGTDVPKSRAERVEFAKKGMLQQADRLRDDIAHSVKSLHYGVSWEKGICFPELEPLAGKPGLYELRRMKTQLEREVADLQADAAMWPTSETKRKFRYVGRRDKCRLEGRYLEPGEEVELTKRRAMNLRDVVEAVDETVTVG